MFSNIYETYTGFKVNDRKCCGRVSQMSIYGTIQLILNKIAVVEIIRKKSVVPKEKIRNKNTAKLNPGFISEETVHLKK